MNKKSTAPNNGPPVFPELRINSMTTTSPIIKKMAATMIPNSKIQNCLLVIRPLIENKDAMRGIFLSDEPSNRALRLGGATFWSTSRVLRLLRNTKFNTKYRTASHKPKRATVTPSPVCVISLTGNTRRSGPLSSAREGPLNGESPLDGCWSLTDWGKSRESAKYPFLTPPSVNTTETSVRAAFSNPAPLWSNAFGRYCICIGIDSIIKAMTKDNARTTK